MKGLNWNEIIKSPCLESSLNEAMLRVIRDRVSKRTIAVRACINLNLMTSVS